MVSVPAELDHLTGPNGAWAAPAPRLTRLDVHGFKSFATRTSFVFEPGITAIVGPNGSGKSNVADAVRWVLGEQGQSALRAKKTEDVIFAGGQGKAPAGMAEATLTFDNSERWLPIDFTEVTVTRRAFRSGDNQYLINGKRVRLKDVAALTASLGQSHVVVGQGLVDAALSQKADERRSLFEHAADLAGLRLKVAEAERNLSETEANSQRLTDLLSELAPRLRSLERAARQAREWQSLRDRLQALQVTHFRRLLSEAMSNEQSAAGATAGQSEALAAAKAELERLEAESATLSAAADRARAALAAHDTERQAIGERLRTTEHERDLAAERAAALARRFDDMVDTRRSLETRADEVSKAVAEVQASLASIEQDLAAAEEAATRHERALAEHRAEGQARERQLRELDARRLARERELSDTTRRQALLAQRLESLQAERTRLQDAAGGTRDRHRQLSRELAEAESAEQTARATLRELEDRLAELTTSGEAAAERLAAVQERLGDSERRLGLASTRLDALSRMHQSGAGLHAGVREVMSASARGALAGVLGTMAELIETDAELDTALEVALGGHLQDIVVERWAEAEAAIAHLKRTKTGRATFQPLDTVRGGRGRDHRADPALRLPGSRGLASDLVRAEPRVRPVVDALLGRTLIVEDLPAARQALPHLPGGWSAVTLAGEIARSGGSVTGGVATRESGLLARERELRELPAEIERLTAERDRLLQEQADLSSHVANLERSRREAVAERAALGASAQERERQRERLTAWVADLEADLAQRDSRLQQIDQDEAAIETETATLAQQEADLQAALSALADEAATIAGDRQRDAAAIAAAEREAAELNQRRASLAERARGERRRQVELQNQAEALAAELETRAERTESLERERANLTAQHAKLVEAAKQIRAEQDAHAEARFPLHSEQRRLDAQLGDMARTVAASRQQVLDQERLYGSSELALARARDATAAIRRQIAQELELDDPETTFEAALASADAEPDDGLDDASREREITRLRERLRRVGYVGQDVVADYEQEAQHQEFLRQQLEDVQGAAASLRGLLAELQTAMRSRFDATFSQVSAVFSEVFSVLFGGGTAQLILTGGEPNEQGVRSEPGVDIVAQPPGKRLQSLALLSGGERALTAVALLFAILRVNPAPFCLLDEVDAALDEANVVRFRDQLSILAEKTQVIIVTHNRGTIETANTLYGVSMGADGVSRVLSMRMADEA